MTAGILIMIGVAVAVLAAMAMLGRRMPSSFASRLHCLGPTKLQDPSPNCPVGDAETTLGEQVLEVSRAQPETARTDPEAGS